jgi:signal transduction histidine kinase
MSGAAPQPAPQLRSEGTLQGRSPLAHLLHALNQPLTGLQCSLELAVAGPRPNEQYVRTLREALELTGRMRILVEAIREVADDQPLAQDEFAPRLDELSLDGPSLDEVLRTTVADLLPVAESKGVRLLLVSHGRLPLRADRRTLTTLLFRLLDSVLSLAAEGSDLGIVAGPDREQAALVVSWTPGPPPEHSPFSRPEVGLLIARAGWERAGAEWIHTRTGPPEATTEACTVRLSLVPGLPHLSPSPSPHRSRADLEI